MGSHQDPHNNRIVVLISGSGTNLQALINACGTSELPSTQIVHVICNRKDAYGLTRAKNAGIPTTYHNLVRYKKLHPSTPEGLQAAREEYDVELAKIILAQQPRLVVCAGWMHVLAPVFVDMMAEASVKAINLHPALPGQFNGANAILRAYEAFQRKEIEKTGIMVHYVVSEVDAGEVIDTQDIVLREQESLEDLKGRIHQAEWGLLVRCTNIAIQRLKSEAIESG